MSFSLVLRAFFVLFFFFFAGVPSSSYISGSASRFGFPLLPLEGLKGSLLYFDGQMNDSRMNLQIALTSTIDGYIEGMKGAAIANHLQIVEFLTDENQHLVRHHRPAPRQLRMRPTPPFKDKSPSSLSPSPSSSSRLLSREVLSDSVLWGRKISSLTHSQGPHLDSPFMRCVQACLTLYACIQTNTHSQTYMLIPSCLCGTYIGSDTCISPLSRSRSLHRNNIHRSVSPCMLVSRSQGAYV